MKNKFYVLLFILPLWGLGGCNDDDNTPPNPIDQLPPATQTGENTFGCLVNGEPFVVTSSSSMVAIYQGNLLQIGAEFEVGNIDYGITIWLERENLIETSYTLNQDVFNIAFFRDSNSACMFYETYNPDSGYIQINYYDNEQFIVSGSFEFEAISADCETIITITDGRFDMQYIP